MEQNTFSTIFKTVVGMTASCGIGALCLSLVPIFFSEGATSPFLEPMFNNLTYLFSTGVGAIFGMLGSRA